MQGGDGCGSWELSFPVVVVWFGSVPVRLADDCCKVRAAEGKKKGAGKLV